MTVRLSRIDSELNRADVTLFSGPLGRDGYAGQRRAFCAFTANVRWTQPPRVKLPTETGFFAFRLKGLLRVPEPLASLSGPSNQKTTYYQ
jgi:hypothetical protein